MYSPNWIAGGIFRPRMTLKKIVTLSLSCLALFAVALSASGPAAAQNGTVFGPNVYVFTPSTPIATINATLATLAGNAQFSTNRYAVFFEPGTYSGVESQVGYYESVGGLGQEPTATAITNGYLTVNTTDSNGNLTTNFWRSVENMAMSLPSGDVEQWGVSQGADFRRMQINDTVELTNTNCGEASGGFIADSVITGNISPALSSSGIPATATLPGGPETSGT